MITRTPEEAVRLWLQALESGEYSQTSRSLKIGNAFCCLGVLCDLARKDGGPEWEDGTGTGTSFYQIPSFLGASLVLPSVVQKYIDLPQKVMDHAIHLNDSDHDFIEIAAYLRKKFKAIHPEWQL